MKNYDYKLKINQNRKRFAKRVGSIALVTTLAMSTPVATNVISESGFKNVLSTSVVEAATDNIVNFVEETNQYSDSYSTKITNYKMGVHVEYPNYTGEEDIRVTWKIPEEMAVGFNENELQDIMKRYASVSGSFLDSDGERVPSSQLGDTSSYVTVNSSNRTVEYNLSGLLKDNELKLDDTIGEPSNLLGIEVMAYNGTVSKGTYPVEVAVTDGPADPGNVTGVYEINFEVSEGTEPEEPEEPEIDTEKLEQAIANAKDYQANDYTEASFAALETAIEVGEGVINSEEATQDEIDEAVTGINDAIEELVEADDPTPEPEADKTDLESELDAIKAENLSEDDYTNASWTTFQGALTAAEAVLADEDATQDETDDALAALTDARNGLETVDEPTPEPEADKTDLESELDAIKAENLSEDDYTNVSWTTFQGALTAAEAVLADEDATQDEIDNTLDALTNARGGLEAAKEPNDPEIDKADLERAIADAKDYKVNDYTEDSFALLTAAIEAAEAVVSNEGATQDEIDNAVTEINEAIKGLVKIEEPRPEPTNPEDPTIPEEVVVEVEDGDEDEIIVDVDSDEDNTLPDTATSTFNWLIGGFIAMLAGVAGLFTRRGRKDSTNSVK